MLWICNEVALGILCSSAADPRRGSPESNATATFPEVEVGDVCSE